MTVVLMVEDNTLDVRNQAHIKQKPILSTYHVGVLAREDTYNSQEELLALLTTQGEGWEDMHPQEHKFCEDSPSHPRSLPLAPVSWVPPHSSR